MQTKLAWFVGLVLLFAPTSRGQAPHPRIWLDSATLTRLNALVVANDPTWVSVKADADLYLTWPVDAYAPATCLTSHICYSYEGLGWYVRLMPLALAYKMTGNVAYATKVKAIMTSMANAGVAPCTVDSGFASRSAMLAMAIGYDWIYDQLTATDKTAFTAEIDTCWNWVQTSGYRWGPAFLKQAFSNYTGGHLLGYGLAALAIEGDDANAPAMQSSILNVFNTIFVPAFTAPSGLMSGGYPIEGYNYGANHIIRIAQFMKAWETAGKGTLFTDNIFWLKASATEMLRLQRPNLWATTNDGAWSGSVAGVLYQNLPYDLAAFLNGTTEGSYLQYFWNNIVTPPSNIGPTLYAINVTNSHWEYFFYNTSQIATNYNTLPTYFFSPGDAHSILRTDWTTSAVQSTFAGLTNSGSDHAIKNTGHVDIWRGSDPLVIQAGAWDGASGYIGSPAIASVDGYNSNILFYWDQGVNCLLQTQTYGKYASCQMFWPTSNLAALKHNEGTGWLFQESDMRPAYLSNYNSTTITAYVRSYVNINDISFVFDRISAPATSQRTLLWHTSALTSATTPGIATALSVSGSLATATVGASKIWINTLLPASPTITQVTNKTSWLATADSTTQRFEVNDANASSCSTNCLFLTVLAPTASGASQPTMSLITAANYYGALYNDGVIPRVAMFANDRTTHNSLTYTAAYDATLKGIHILTDLNTGTYDVIKDNAGVYSGLVVGPDGCLRFTTLGGGTYRIQNTGFTVLLPPSGVTATVQ